MTPNLIGPPVGTPFSAPRRSEQAVAPKPAPAVPQSFGTTPVRLDPVYQAGVTARKDGLPVTECPDWPDPDRLRLRRVWVQGWYDRNQKRI